MKKYLAFLIILLFSFSALYAADSGRLINITGKVEIKGSSGSWVTAAEGSTVPLN